MKKLAFYSKQVSKSISKKLASLEITYSDIAIQLFFVIVVIALLFNINTAFTKGQDNIRRIQEEEQRLDDIYAENKRLRELEKYFSSVEFRRTYARDSWNLAEEGETLYYIQRPPELEIEFLQKNEDPILLRDNLYWWKRLIFGS